MTSSIRGETSARDSDDVQHDVDCVKLFFGNEDNMGTDEELVNAIVGMIMIEVESEGWMEGREETDLYLGERASSSTIGKFWEVLEAAGSSGESIIKWDTSDA